MLKKLLSLSLIGIVFFSSCYDIRITEHPEWQSIFEEYGVEGTFEYYDNNKEIAHYIKDEYHTTPLPPYKTFNIFNAIVALEYGTAPTEEYRLPIGQDTTTMSMTQAFQAQNETYFKNLATKIGAEEMQFALDTVRFGNKKISTIDNFWNDSLQISPDEYVGFMKRFYHANLPFSERSQRIVKGMMDKVVTDKYERYTYKSVTNTNGVTTVWIVGFVEQINSLKHVETKQLTNIPHPYFFTFSFQAKDAQKDWNQAADEMLEKLLVQNKLDQ